MLTTLRTPARAAMLAALVGGFALAVPTTARAQSVTPERALLNRHEAAPSGAAHAVARAALDGERALLNQSRATQSPLGDPPNTGQPAVAERRYPDAVRALLNRSTL